MFIFLGTLVSAAHSLSQLRITFLFATCVPLSPVWVRQSVIIELFYNLDLQVRQLLLSPNIYSCHQLFQGSKSYLRLLRPIIISHKKADVVGKVMFLTTHLLLTLQGSRRLCRPGNAIWDRWTFST